MARNVCARHPATLRRALHCPRATRGGAWADPRPNVGGFWADIGSMPDRADLGLLRGRARGWAHSPISGCAADQALFM